MDEFSESAQIIEALSRLKDHVGEKFEGLAKQLGSLDKSVRGIDQRLLHVEAQSSVENPAAARHEQKLDGIAAWLERIESDLKERPGKEAWESAKHRIEKLENAQSKVTMMVIAAVIGSVLGFILK